MCVAIGLFLPHILEWLVVVVDGLAPACIGMHLHLEGQAKWWQTAEVLATKVIRHSLQQLLSTPLQKKNSSCWLPTRWLVVVCAATAALHAAFCQKTSLQAFSCGWLGMRLEAGQSVTVTYTAVARQAGTFVNTAKSAPTGDKDVSNEAAVTVTVTVGAPIANLPLQKLCAYTRFAMFSQF